MKQNGFTLIELLTVVIILSSILLLAVPRVMDLANDVKDDSFTSLAHIAVGSAKSFISINDSFSIPATAGECKLITFEELEMGIQKSPYDIDINLSNSYVLVDNSSSYYVTITTESGEKGIKNLISTKIDNEPIPIITFEADDANKLEVPVVSSFSVTSGSETDMQLDTNGDKVLGDATCKLIEIRN